MKKTTTTNLLNPKRKGDTCREKNYQKEKKLKNWIKKNSISKEKIKKYNKITKK